MQDHVILPRYVVIHESDSPFGSPSVIDDWHKERGFNRDIDEVRPGELEHIGYQAVITNGRTQTSAVYELAEDGRIYDGRHESESGAHDPSMNARSVGVCLVGRGGQYTKHQLATLILFVCTLLCRYRLSPDRVIGHYETPTQRALPESKRKACPSIDMNAFRAKLARVYDAIKGDLEL